MRRVKIYKCANDTAADRLCERLNSMRVKNHNVEIDGVVGKIEQVERNGREVKVTFAHHSYSLTA